MKIGYRSPGLKGLTFRQKFELAKECDLDAVEFGIQEFSEPYDPEEIRGMADEMGLVLNALGNGTNLANINLRRETYEKTMSAAELCRTLNIPVIFTRTLSPAEGVAQPEVWEACIETTREAATICADHGVAFALEADPPCFVQNLERVERLLEGVNHPNLHVNFDPTNYYVVGSDPLKVIEQLGHLMVNGHIKDGVYRTEKKGETEIGEGEVPYRDIFRALKEKNIDIVMSIEHCRKPEQVRSGAEFIHGVLASLGGG